MKKITFIITALAALCSCNKSEMPAGKAQNGGETVNIVANAIAGEASKVTMGAKDGDVYPISWNESGERVFLREVVRDTDPSKTTNADTGSVSFVKLDAQKAEFSFRLNKQTKETTYDYAAVYPCNPAGVKIDLQTGVRAGGTDAKNRVSYCLNHEKKQTPLPDGPDPATHIMVASVTGLPAQATSLDLQFEYVVGFGRMTVKNFPALAADETASKITVTVPAGQKMTGRKYHYFHDNTDGSHKAGDIIDYSSTTVKNYVMLDPKNITFNTTGFDVWFTTYPISLAADDVVSLSIETNKKTYTADIKLSKALKFEAGVVSEFVYDYVKGQPKAETKTLTFDFSSSTALEGWPTSDNWQNGPGNKTCVYTLDEVDYNFLLTDCGNASKARVFWSNDGRGVVLGATWRYFGFPVISGYKLIKVSCVQGTADSDTGRKAAITKSVSKNNSSSSPDYEPYDYQSGGDDLQWTKKGDTYSWNLTNTFKDTMYYLTCTKGGIGVTSLTLVYEKVEE